MIKMFNNRFNQKVIDKFLFDSKDSPFLALIGILMLSLLGFTVLQLSGQFNLINQNIIGVHVLIIHEVIFAICSPLIVMFIFQLFQANGNANRLNSTTIFSLSLLWLSSRLFLFFNNEVTVALALFCGAFFWFSMIVLVKFYAIITSTLASTLLIICLMCLLILDTGMLLNGINENYIHSLYFSQIGLALLAIMVTTAVINMSFELVAELKQNNN